MTPAEMVLAEMRKSGQDESRLREILATWELHPFYEGEDLKGVAMTKGTEYHCHLAPGFRLSRRVMRDFLKPLFDRHGFLTTRVAHDDTANQRFNQVFGFKLMWSDDRFHYYMMTELPFEEKKTCQQ